MTLGTLITFEGPEGAGKSTQIGLLEERLKKDGVEVVRTFEPGGGSPLSTKLRKILLSEKYDQICCETELFLMLAARAEHVQKLILPALAKGCVVLCDRFIDSTTAYQGYGRGLPVKTIQLMNQFAIMGRYPDLTVIIDIDSAQGLERAGRKAGLDRIESAGGEFHKLVREGFRTLATEEDRYFLVDGDRSLPAIHDDIYARVIRIIK
tara:strand:+ start:2376 stop:2999 length:624 start_codon:yes stop_codon:yes gene_type:complete